MAGIQQSSFLRLPRELRDQIYEDYVFEEDGYMYDFAARKMRVNSPSPVGICQDLRFACKQISEETRGVALRVNVLNFETGASEKVDGGVYDGLSLAARWKCSKLADR